MLRTRADGDAERLRGRELCRERECRVLCCGFHSLRGGGGQEREERGRERGARDGGAQGAAVREGGDDLEGLCGGRGVRSRVGGDVDKGLDVARGGLGGGRERSGVRAREGREDAERGRAEGPVRRDEAEQERERLDVRGREQHRRARGPPRRELREQVHRVPRALRVKQLLVQKSWKALFLDYPCNRFAAAAVVAAIVLLVATASTVATRENSTKEHEDAGGSRGGGSGLGEGAREGGDGVRGGELGADGGVSGEGGEYGDGALAQLGRGVAHEGHEVREDAAPRNSGLRSGVRAEGSEAARDVRACQHIRRGVCRRVCEDVARGWETAPRSRIEEGGAGRGDRGVARKELCAARLGVGVRVSVE